MSHSPSEQESLKIIEDMINKGKHNIQEGSIFYLLWGWAVLVTCILEYVTLTVYSWEYHWVFWPITMTLTGITSGVIGSKRYGKQKFTTFIDNSMQYVWGGFILFLVIILFTGPKVGWEITYALLVGLYGVGTFISGGILKFRPLIIGGLISLLLSAAAVILPNMLQQFSDALILLAISIVVSYLVPGYILRAKKEKYAA